MSLFMLNIGVKTLNKNSTRAQSVCFLDFKFDWPLLPK